MGRKSIGLAAVLATLGFAASGAPVAIVEAVQYPAWIERGGQRAPLAPGMEVKPGEKLLTGADGRAHMKLAEGSTVKVGPQASFGVETAQAGSGGFRATLTAVSGAFRFTTDESRKGERRDVEIRTLNVTAGVRGTDLWGKSTPERSFVVLIEGRIETGSPGHPSVTLTRPYEVYERRRDAAPAVRSIDAATLEEYAKETEMGAAGAVARAGGRWQVVAATRSERPAAVALGEVLRSRGYPAEVAPGAAGTFEVIVAGLAGGAEARALADRLRKGSGVSTPTVRLAP
jgi:hypothetical protein